MGGHRAGEVAPAMSETVSNLVKHAKAGVIVLRIVRTGQHTGIEFLALDDGPGMADTAASMRDGRSTTGTLGIGLGMVARLALLRPALRPRAGNRDARPLPAAGHTAAPSGHRRGPRQCVVRGVTRPISGAPARGDAPPACGDGWAADRDDTQASAPRPATRDAVAGARLPDRTGPAPALVSLDPGRAVSVMPCDGLGHGPLAKSAARPAIRAFHTGGTRPEQIVHRIHRALAGTRCAAVAVARVEPDRGRVLFCGAGDTAAAAAIVTPTSKTGLPSPQGIVGHRIRSPHTTTHPLPPGSAPVMHSDGLTRRWNPETLHGVLRHSPTVIAGHLPRAAGKHHDDASVVVIKGPW